MVKITVVDFSGAPVVDFMLPMQGTWVQSLVKELRSHIPETKKQNRKKTENCNKFNKEFKKKAR